jgi:hypothetical protein
VIISVVASQPIDVSRKRTKPTAVKNSPWITRRINDGQYQKVRTKIQFKINIFP